MNKQDLIKNIAYTAKNFDLVNWASALVEIKDAVKRNDWGKAQELAIALEGDLEIQITEAKYLIEDIETNDDFGRTE